jgi:biopolymer transport protein ExbD
MAGAIDSSSGTDVELPLAPIIDCFVVLISFLLISATYVSVSIFNADVAIVEQTSNPSEVTTGILASLEVTENGDYRIVLSGDVNESYEVPKKRSIKEQKAELDIKLKELKTKYETVRNITLKAANNIPYKDLVNAMEVARVYYPQILLGGF